MGKSIFVVNPESEHVEFGEMEESVFHWASGKTMPTGWGKKVLQEIEQEGEDTDLEPELQCMRQVRNPQRELQCREARGEVVKESRWRFLLEADWPTIIIGLWLYMFPFLVGLAGLLLAKVG